LQEKFNIVAYRPLLGKDRETNNETTAVARQQPAPPMDWLSSDHVGNPADKRETIEELCFLFVRAEGL
jgi:hypothetical protein